MSEPVGTGKNASGTGPEPAGSVRRDTGGRFAAGGVSANPDGRGAGRKRLEAMSQPRIESFGSHIVRDHAEDASASIVFRGDGWTSLLSGFGTSMYDKRESFGFTPDIVTWDSARNIWRGDDLAARIIETFPGEMIREGAEFCVTDEKGNTGEDERPAEKPGEVKPKPLPKRTDWYGTRLANRLDSKSKDLAERVASKWDELGMWKALYDALCYERAYGGGAILVGANDGSEDLSLPLNTQSVRSIDFLTALEPREVMPLYYYGNPRAPRYGEVALYQITPITGGASAPGTYSQSQTLVVHESRLIVFGGVRVTRQQLDTGWGDSVLSRVWRVLRDFNISWSATGSIIADFAQPVYKMKGLNDLLNEDPTDLFKRRIQGMELARSTIRVAMIDAEDEYKREQTPVTGLPDLLDRYEKRLAAAADMPLTLLMGMSPGGLNATGASDIRLFYDRVASRQRRQLEPAIRRITQMILMSIGGEPNAWSITFRPLWQLTEKELAETRKIQMDTDTGYMDRNVITDREVRNSRFGGDAYSYETQLDESNESAGPSPEEIEAFKAEMGQAPTAAVPGETPSPMDPTGKPAAGAVKPTTPGREIAKEAMNGAQISSLLEVIQAANDKAISRESAAAVLRLAFQIGEDDANSLLGPEDFEPVKPPAPVSPFGGGGGAPSPAPNGKMNPPNQADKPPAIPSGKKPTESTEIEE